MKKKIRIRMTNDMAEKLTGARGRYDLALPEIDVDLDALSPAARWIAEHITATYVLDEARDMIGISAETGFSMRDRDIAAGINPRTIEALETTWGEYYSKDPLHIDEISFPVMGRRYSRPEDVLEDAAAQLIDAGAVKLTARNGECFDLIEGRSMGKTWFAIMMDTDDQDWGAGTFDRDEAVQRVKDLRAKYPEAYVAVIELGENPVCVDEIRNF